MNRLLHAAEVINVCSAWSPRRAPRGFVSQRGVDSCHHHLLPRYTASLFLLPPYVDFLVVVVALFSAVFYRAKVVEDAFFFSCTF